MKYYFLSVNKRHMFFIGKIRQLKYLFAFDACLRNTLVAFQCSRPEDITKIYGAAPADPFSFEIDSAVGQKKQCDSMHKHSLIKTNVKNC